VVAIVGYECQRCFAWQGGRQEAERRVEFCQRPGSRLGRCNTTMEKIVSPCQLAMAATWGVEEAMVGGSYVKAGDGVDLAEERNSPSFLIGRPGPEVWHLRM
jgi:hypothetical protein